MENEIKEFLNVVEDVDANVETVETTDSEFNKMTNLAFPDPAIVHYWREHSDRVIWIDDKIEDDIIGVARNIIRWNNEDKGLPVEERKPIKLYINSPGGLLVPTFAVCDVIRMSKTPVWAINMHEACSAAALIFICCHRRAALPNAYFLLHLGSGGSCGTFQQTRAQQADYDHKINQMIELFKTSLGIDNEDAEEFEKNIDGEWYLYMDTNDNSRSDARRYNLITDEVTDLCWN